jgi:hypothetical protein
MDENTNIVFELLCLDSNIKKCWGFGLLSFLSKEIWQKQ